MQKWEYLAIDINWVSHAFQQQLEELGSQGWELVTTLTIAGSARHLFSNVP